MPADISNKLIIADTSCLIVLSNVGYLEMLYQLCHTIMVTPEVAVEYKDPLPEWVQIATVKDTQKIKSLHNFLGMGESSAIALGLESENALVILDDKKARRYAQSMGLNIIGTLGLCIEAYKQGLIGDMDGLLAALKATDFRLPANIDQLIK
jgi:predicted nucleic acid-binding protein